MLLKKARARARNILYDVDGAKTLDARVMKEGCGNILPLAHKWMLNCFWHFAFHDADAENILQWCLTTLQFFWPQERYILATTLLGFCGQEMNQLRSSKSWWPPRCVTSNEMALVERLERRQSLSPCHIFYFHWCRDRCKNWYSDR